MSRKIIIAGLLFTAAAVFLFFVRPPGEPAFREEVLEHAVVVETPLVFSSGKLPGVTWADDIPPIFVENKCCHRYFCSKSASPYS